MDIAINPKFNFTFTARRVKFPKEYITKTLMPLYESKCSPADMVKKTDLPKSVVDKWIKDTFNKTSAKVRREFEEEQINKEIMEHVKSGKSDEQIAEIYGRTVKWVREKYRGLKVTMSHKDIDEKLAANVPQMLLNGITVNEMRETLNISRNKISDWIKLNFGKSIVTLRHENNVRINHKLNSRDNEFKKTLHDLFSVKGLSIKEVADLLNKPKARIFYWMKIFNITSAKQDAHHNMKILVPDMMEKKMTLSEMSKEIGLTEATISRWIKKEYGQFYKDWKQSH